MGMDTILGNGGIHHVAVRTTDLDASVRFLYRCAGDVGGGGF